MSTPLEQVSKIDFSRTLSDSWAGFKSKCGVLVGATIIYMILVGLLSTLPGLFVEARKPWRIWRTLEPQH